MCNRNRRATRRFTTFVAFVSIKNSVHHERKREKGAPREGAGHVATRDIAVQPSAHSAIANGRGGSTTTLAATARRGGAW